MTKKAMIQTRVKSRELDFPFKLMSATYGIADARTPLIERRDYECCTVEFIYKGRGFLELNGHSFSPGENSVYILHKHSNHRYWPDKNEPWEKLFFVIDGSLMEYLFRTYGLDKTCFIPDCPQLKKYFDEMMQLRHGIGEINRQAAIVFHRMLEECHTILYGSPNQFTPPEILELKKFLDDNVERKVKLDRYCSGKHRSCAGMIRRFKKHFGTSPYDYLMQKRIEEARLMLRHSAFSVKEIASRLKFSDQYYFSNYFKRKTGMSPQKYRKGI
ncbi:MAG: AraC family transcriptional regulator [Victivallales bacterium]